MSRLTWNLALHWDWWIVSCCSHLLYWSFRFEVIGSHLGFFGKGRLPFLSLICSYLNTWHFRRAPGMASSSLHPRGLYSLSPQCLVHSARMECAARVHGSQVFFAHLKWYRLKNLRTFFFFLFLVFSSQVRDPGYSLWTASLLNSIEDLWVIWSSHFFLDELNKNVCSTCAWQSYGEMAPSKLRGGRKWSQHEAHLFYGD